VEVVDTSAAELADQNVSPAEALLQLNSHFTAWCETVYHRRVHTETGQTPLARWHDGWERLGHGPSMASADALTEAFLWSAHRAVNKSATISLHGNVYQVDEALVGRKVAAHRVVQRARVLLLAADGVSNSEISDIAPPVTGDSEADVAAMVRTLIEVFSGPAGHVLPALALDLADDPDALRRLAAVVGPYRATNAETLLIAAGHGDSPYNIDTTVTLDAIVGVLIYRRMMRRPLDDALAAQLTQLIVSGHLPRQDPTTP
jgi:hypothetical protein